MNQLLFLTLLLFAPTSHALDANGRWQGQGLVLEGTQSTTADFDLFVDLSKDHFYLEACTQSIGELSCQKTVRRVDNFGNLFNKEGKKVGDVYPFSLTLFEGNAQVSEQILLKTNARGQLFYSYSLINMDGGVSHQRGILQLISD